MKNIKFLYLLMILCCYSCSTDDPIIEQLEPAYYPVESKTVGRVLDERGTPIEDAIVELNGRTTTTNNLGLFKFDKMELNGAGTNLIVRKLGYFNAYRTFIPNIPTISSVTVYMIERPPSASFQHDTGGSIGLSNGASVSFSPNSIVSETGAPYSGEVQVSMYFLDPTDVNALSLMPGNLRGYSLNGDLMTLASYGMMIVELTSPSGEQLNIGNGMTATVVFPVNNTLLSVAPAVIGLWSFNEVTGYLEEESTANLVGTNYIAEVSHFSWAVLCEGISMTNQNLRFEICVTNSNGTPLQGARVSVVDPQLSLQNIHFPLGFGYTNQNGKAFGWMPDDTELKFSISYSPESPCPVSTSVSFVRGPFDGSVPVEIITAELDPPSPINFTKEVIITGNFLNCNGNPVTDGVVLTSMQGAAIPINPDGTVEFSMYSCSEWPDEIEVLVHDFSEFKTSPLTIYPTAQSVNNIELVDFEVCDNIDEYIIIEYGSESILFDSPIYGHGLSEGGYEHGVSGSLPNNTRINVGWPADTNGTPVLGNHSGFFIHWLNNIYSDGSLEIEISDFTKPGYVFGTYSGTMWITGQSSLVDVSGSFRVKTQ